jgi:ABC-type dipeptide/oligopeptide/nickel transport system permease subunit
VSRRQRALVLAVVGAALAHTAVRIGPSLTFHTTVWLFAEVGIALALAQGLGLAATLTAGPRTEPYLNQFVSRGVELTAALPMILLCAVVAVATRWPVPIAVAVIIGVLGGLRCVRVVAAATLPAQSSKRDAPKLASVLRDAKRTLYPLVPTTLEQVVGLEAALAWLGLFDQGWTGGWGEQLGHAASHGQPARVVWWTLSTAALSVGLKVLLWQAPKPFANGKTGGYVG